MMFPSISTDAAPPNGGTKIIMLAGAIKWWWLARCLNCDALDEPHVLEAEDHCIARPGETHDLYVHWDSPEHREYVAHRNAMRAALIDAGFLTYAPHEAFKGRWDERAQVVNNAVIANCDAMVVMSPESALTEGTDEEVATAHLCNRLVLYVPPGPLAEVRTRMVIWTLGSL